MYGLDVGMIIFVGIYLGIAALCFIAAGRKLYKKLTKKKRPKLTLIQGGKKDNGPYGKSR